jgi:hypothetical protein
LINFFLKRPECSGLFLFLSFQVLILLGSTPKMKKPVAILFLLLAGTMYWGLIISYIGCRFLPSSSTASFCSCEQAIISSLYQHETDHPFHDGMISKAKGDFGINLFSQHSMHYLEDLPTLSSARTYYTRPDFRAIEGFVGAILRPPARVNYYFPASS